MARVGTMAALAATVGAALLTACEPAPPRTTFVVNSTATTTDAVPGNGVCATSGGECTLFAALQEAERMTTGVDIVLPSGTYSPVLPVVKGDIRINWGAPQLVQITGTITVPAGSRLALDGVNTAMPTPPSPSGLTVVAAGEVRIQRTLLQRLEIASGATAVLDRSMVVDGTEGLTQGAVTNRGTLVALNATLAGYPDSDSVVLDNTGGQAFLHSTVIATPTVNVNGSLSASGGTGTCTGGTYQTFGYVHVEVPCAGLGSEVSTGNANVISQISAAFGGSGVVLQFAIVLPASSPLVDAIPLDDPTCAASLTDLSGTVRGVDGNADGIGGCDIGGLERPAA